MSNVFQNTQLERIADSLEGSGGGSSVTINMDVTGVGDMQGATASAAGVHGLVPAPAAGDENKVLTGAGTWAEVGGGSTVGELGDLEDVDLTNPISGESLKYDGSKWVNGTVTAELPDFIEETSGNIVTVDAAERPAKSLVVIINPVQSGSGDPSPTNIRPISGWTGCNVVVSPTIDAEDGTTYHITFPSEAGTVYGGTLDVTNGVLTVTMAEVDLGALKWVLSPSYGDGVFTVFIRTLTTKPNYSNLLCSTYRPVISSTPWSAMADKDCKKANTSSLFAIRDNAYTDAESFKTAMSGVQLVYELATPIIYQLTPTEVQMLLGTNNIWADTGEIKELKYIPQTYDGLLEEVDNKSLETLSDVELNSPTDGQGLVWDATARKWVNGDVGGGGGGIDYSLTRQKTGIKWIDGKDIYQQTFDIAGVQYSSPNYVTLASVPGIDLLIGAQCVVYEGTDGTVVPDINQRLRIVSGGDIQIYTESSWNLTSGSHLTVWFTIV